MNPGGLLGLLAASVVIIAVPGPSVMYLLGNALALGRGPALRAVLGNTLGMTCVAVAVAFGLSAVFARYPWMQPAVRVVGALVLVRIGWGYLRSRATWAESPAASESVIDDEVVPPSSRLRSPARSALATSVLVGVSNPKALVMFGVMVPSFAATGTSPTPGTLLAMSTVPLVTGLVLDSAWVLAASAARGWFLQAPDRLVTVNRAGGVLMLGMAAVMLSEVFLHG